MNLKDIKKADIEYGLIGEKLSHSYSQLIHDRLGDYRYELYSIAPDDLDAFMKARRFKGLNVTIPYKKAVIPYCDELSRAALRIGSVNTLVIRDDGSLYGHNTDYDGFIYAVRSAKIDFSGKKVLILGSGGTSMTAQAAVSDLGALEVVVVSRNGEVNYESIYEQRDAEIVVNTTPVGMYPNNSESPLDLSRFSHLSGVVDVIYNPLHTALLLQAEKLGIPCTCGLPMLVAQAKAASELFFSKSIDDSETRRISKALLGKVTNIVLVGMPGSGKTSIGRAVAEYLGRRFVDTDDLIVERAGLSIPDIFERMGEPEFRRMENEVIIEIGKEKGLVIATGGGAILSETNRDALRQNGRVYHITRTLQKLATDNRPLSKSIEALQAIYAEREPIYDAFRDITVPNESDIGSAAGLIMEDYRENFGN